MENSTEISVTGSKNIFDFDPVAVALENIGSGKRHSDPIQAALAQGQAEAAARKRRLAEERDRMFSDPAGFALRVMGVDPAGMTPNQIEAAIVKVNAEALARNEAYAAFQASNAEAARKRRVEGLILAASCPTRHGLNSDSSIGHPRWLAYRDLLVEQAGYPNGFIVALLGTSGTGKTQLGVSLIHECCRKLMACRYVKVLDLFRDLRRAYSPVARGERGERESDIVAKWAAYDLLVIDEAHQRGETEWEQNALINLLDRRYDNRQCTLLIANQTEETFADAMGSSIVSRIHECGEAIICDWPSFRKPGGWRQAGAIRKPSAAPKNDPFAACEITATPFDR
jgi:DNA replication protein DnaC